jgi:hypothetical protein
MQVFAVFQVPGAEALFVVAVSDVVCLQRGNSEQCQEEETYSFHSD